MNDKSLYVIDTLPQEIQLHIALYGASYNIHDETWYNEMIISLCIVYMH